MLAGRDVRVADADAATGAGAPRAAGIEAEVVAVPATHRGAHDGAGPWGMRPGEAPVDVSGSEQSPRVRRPWRHAA